MANNFPALPAPQVGSLEYVIEVASTSGVLNQMPPGRISLINFGFQTFNSDGTVTIDYSAHDQDAHEAQMATMLNGVCGMWAANLGVALVAVQSALTVHRIWTMVSGTSSGSYSFEWADVMPYPA